MFSKLRKIVVDRIELPVLLKAATKTANNEPLDFVAIVRDEAVSVVKEVVFFYAITMNLVFGGIGFLLGCILMYFVM